MKLLLPIMFILAMVATANAQGYPTGDNDPAYQLTGYTLHVDQEWVERVHLTLPAAIAWVQDYVLTRIVTKRINLTAVEIWGGSAISATYQYQFPLFGWAYGESLITWKYIRKG